MNWKKWLTASFIIIAVTNIIVVSALPEEVIGLNIALLAGIFSGVAYLAWWENRHEDSSDMMT